MKKLLILLLLVVTQTAWSQKEKRQSINATLLNYPIIPLPESFKTYQVTTEKKGISATEFTKISAPETVILLTGFEKTNSLADLNIKVTVGEPQFYNLASTTRIKSLNELKGSSATMIEYTISLTYEVTDKQGLIIQKEFYGGTDFTTEVIENSSKKSVSSADVINGVTTAINIGLERMNSRLLDLFCFYRQPMPANVQVHLFEVQPSKTDKFEAYNQPVSDIEAAFKNKVEQAALSETLKKSIASWGTILETLNSNVETDKVKYFVCVYNTSVAYGLLDEFEKAQEFIVKTEATNSREGYVSLLKTQINKRKKIKDEYLIEKEKTTQNPDRIYQRNQAKKEAPGSIFEAMKTKPATDTQASAYTEKGFLITTKSDTVFGSFIEFDANSKKGLISFVPNGGNKKDYPKPFTEIRIVSTKGQAYLNSGGQLKQLVYASSTLLVLNGGTEALFYIGNETRPVTYTLYDPEDGASFVTNYKKKLAEVFKGKCEAVEKKALSGEYDLKKPGTDPLLNAIRDYETNCGSKQYDSFMAIIQPENLRRRYK